MPGPPESVKEHIEQLARFEPRTRSGEIMRGLLRDMAEGHEPGDVTTMRDASVLDALQRVTSPGGAGTQETGSTR